MFRGAGVTDSRLSIGIEYTVPAVILGARLDDRSGTGRPQRASFMTIFNLPFGPAGFRQALRPQIGQRVPRRHVKALAISHVF